MINVAVVGYGLAGRVFHAPLIASTDGLRLHTIVSSQRERLRLDYPAVNVVDALPTVLADAAIDVVVLAVPNAVHFSYANEALSAGKHVVVDKPFTINSAEADELIGLADRQNRVLSVFQNRRWDGDFLTVKKVIAAGLLGRIYQFESHFDRFRPTVRDRWREQPGPGAGILYDLGAHLIDQALQLFGQPEWLQADVAGQRPRAETDDYFHLTLGYGPLRVLLHSSAFTRRPVFRFAVHGDKGSLVKRGLDVQEGQLAAGMRPGDALYGEDAAADYATIETDVAGVVVTGSVATEPGRYDTYYRQLVAAVNGEGEAVSAESARDVIRLIEAAFDSARSGQTVRLA